MGSVTPESESASNEPQRRCSTCCSDIHSAAKKCTACGSYQDWRRHLQISSSVLALLVALVSVIALSLPMIDRMITPEESKTVLSYHGTSGDKFYFVASNSGNKSGVVGPIEWAIWYYSSNETKAYFHPLVKKPVVVEAGATRQIEVDIPKALAKENIVEGLSQIDHPNVPIPKMKIRVGVTEFGKSAVSRDFEDTFLSLWSSLRIRDCIQGLRDIAGKTTRTCSAAIKELEEVIAADPELMEMARRRGLLLSK